MHGQQQNFANLLENPYAAFMILEPGMTLQIGRD